MSKVIAQASQPETAYVLAALDLAEPEPLWTTVIDRLRFAAAGEGNAARARSALVYALAKSGDVAGARRPSWRSSTRSSAPYPDPVDAACVRRTRARGDGERGADAGAPAALARAAPSAARARQPAGRRARRQACGRAAGSRSRRRRCATGGDGMQAAAQAIKKGDWERARQIYDALVTRNPNDSEALCGLGDVARAQGDSAGAIAAYKRVIGINPSYLPALLGLADTQWATGDRASAHRGYRDIADRFPEGTYPAYVKHARPKAPAAARAAPAASPLGQAGTPPAGAESAAGE